MASLNKKVLKLQKSSSSNNLTNSRKSPARSNSDDFQQSNTIDFDYNPNKYDKELKKNNKFESNRNQTGCDLRQQGHSSISEFMLHKTLMQT